MTNATSTSLLLILLLASEATAANRRRASSGGLRRKVHVADIITTPDTIEVEWYNTFPTEGGAFMPSLIKITPFWQTEFSVGFDPLDRDGAMISALTVITSGPKFSLAAGPQFHIGNDSQAGGFGLARWDLGAHNIGLTASWAGVLDLGVGYGVQVRRWTPHVNGQWEKPRSSRGYFSITEGIGFSITKKLTLDLAGLHLGSATGPVEHQVQFGLIYNLGKFRR